MAAFLISARPQQQPVYSGPFSDWALSNLLILVLFYCSFGIWTAANAKAPNAAFVILLRHAELEWKWQKKKKKK